MNKLEDRLALKDLVDRFAIFGDRKDSAAQASLFTEDGTIEVYSEGKLTMALQGREDIERVFTLFLKDFEIVYHFNGQQTVELDKETAKGIAYCTATLIHEENGKKIRTTNGIHYLDDYIKIEDQWLFVKRETIFDWSDKHELGN